MAFVSNCRSLKNAVPKKTAKNIFLTFFRSKNTRFKGYYMRKLSTPVYERRKEEYRRRILEPLELMPSLQQRLNELNAKDPILDAKVNIGLPTPERASKVKERLEWRKTLVERKRQLLSGHLSLDLAEIQKDWQASNGPAHVQNIADHYGIFTHLYEHGFFTPWVPLTVGYDYDKDYINPVCMGNILEASEAAKTPNVMFAGDSKDLWALVFTNLDGHLLDTNLEYLHWFVGNIKGNDITSGEVVCDYLQPFPMRGTGYHRMVYVLYKQDKEIDFSSLKKNIPCKSLKERTFKTFDFYKEYQDVLTPAGLSFFQCVWDSSLTDFFHNTLNMREPVFEYIEPPLYIKPQEQFPHLEPFNLYLDRYRDPKEIKKEVLLKRLKMIHPFKEEPMPKYPTLHKPENYQYSWQKQDIRKERLRLGKYRDLRPASVYPQEDNVFPYWHKA